MTDGLTLADLVLAAGVAFFLGSVPTAWLVARSRGVNIFNVGTRQAGAANVYREVGRTAAIFVGVVDAAKGGVAILIAIWAGLEGSWLLLPAVAAILGHWNSPMTRFRGGDGVATAVGVLLIMSPTGLFVPVLLGASVTLVLSNFMEHPSPWGGFVGLTTIVLFSSLEFTGLSAITVIGVLAIAASIYLHSYMYHRRKVGAFTTVLMDDDLTDAPIPRTQKPQAPA
ncbi:MAG: glycerol-3-phosphate acyltransferase [Chloroflexi bacterium]|nr:glycerol-3-phosphate acyltransferase [Chloroflexota bacterium]